MGFLKKLLCCFTGTESERTSTRPTRAVTDNRRSSQSRLSINESIQSHVGGRRNSLPPDTQEKELRAFIKAYEAARFYHNVLIKENVPSIEQHGLLNIEDRNKLPGGDEIIGMSQQFRDSEYSGDERKGVFMGSKLFRKTSGPLNGKELRLYLPKNRTEYRKEFMPKHVDAEDRDILFQDPKFRGDDGGGRITKNSISAKLVSAESIETLLADESPDAKINSMLEAVATHYPSSSPAPTLARMKDLLRIAITEETATGRTTVGRRLSNAAFDNLDGWQYPAQ